MCPKHASECFLGLSASQIVRRELEWKRLQFAQCTEKINPFYKMCFCDGAAIYCSAAKTLPVSNTEFNELCNRLLFFEQHEKVMKKCWQAIFHSLPGKEQVDLGKVNLSALSALCCLYEL